MVIVEQMQILRISNIQYLPFKYWRKDYKLKNNLTLEALFLLSYYFDKHLFSLAQTLSKNTAVSHE